MDMLHEVKLANSIAEFVVIASECISISQNASVSRESETIQVVLSTLQESTAKTTFTPSEHTILFTERETIFQDVCKKCELLSLQLQSSLDEHSEKFLVNGTSNVTPEKQLQSIKSALNDKLAFKLIADIDRTLRDLSLKNTRLSLNRGAEMAQLKDDIAKYFKWFRSKNASDVEVSSIFTSIVAIVEKTIDFSAEQAILGDLYFQTIHHRQELIAKEHENTFEWIFDQTSTTDSNPKANFLPWLSNEESIYWISGKPGSGKSTLVKYLTETPKTVEALKNWSGEDRLYTVSFYFWSSAKDSLQKSDLGLLRSILFQMLGKCPELVPYAFPEQWEERHSGSGQVKRFVPVSGAEDYLAAFRRIADELQSKKVKFCLFIDGLDEFDGKMEDVIRLVDIMSETKNIKACLSSRPWTEFEASFGGNNPWKLYIHELTRADMKLYISSLIGGNEQFLRLQKDTKEAEITSFVEDVINAAEGVFLWVYLVIHDLLDKLLPSSGISVLQKQLASIPHDLDKYFERLLLEIDPESREQSARIFITTLQAVQALPLMSYWFEEHISIDEVFEKGYEPISKDIATERLQETSDLLGTGCKGLLKIYNNQEGQEPPELKEHNWLFDFRVDFLHRTVADFLSSTEIRQFLQNWVNDDFNVHLEICKASLATVKAVPSYLVYAKDPQQFLSILHSFFSHTKLLEHTSASSQTQDQLLNDIVSSLKYHDGEDGLIKRSILGPGNYWAYESSFEFVFSYHCVSYSLARYVIQSLNNNSISFSEPKSGLLSACLSRDARVRTNKFSMDLETMKLMLAEKLDINLPWGDRGFSFWQQLVTTTYGNYLKGTMEEVEYDALRYAKEHGGNEKAAVELVVSRGLSDVKAGGLVQKMLSGEHFLN